MRSVSQRPVDARLTRLRERVEAGGCWGDHHRSSKKGIPNMTVMGVARFERLFRAAAELDVDKNDLKRYSDFVNEKLYDLVLIGQAAARANGSGMIEPWDLPITKGLQESIHRFRSLDEDIELQPILEQLAGLPQLDLLYSDDLRDQLPTVVGGLTLAVARTFKIIDPRLKTPARSTGSAPSPCSTSSCSGTRVGPRWWNFSWDSVPGRGWRRLSLRPVGPLRGGRGGYTRPA